MNLTRLESFVAVAEELHFGRAAARLHLSQPALSQQVRLLEADLGTELLVRSRRRVALTAAGAQALDEARDLLRRAGQLRSRVRHAAQGEVGHASIGFSVDYLYRFLPLLLGEFHREHPHVRLQSRIGVSSALAEDVAAGDLDLAFVMPPLTAHAASLEEMKLGPVTVVAVLPAAHPLARRREIELARLEGERFVLPPPVAWTGFYAQVAALFDEAGFIPQVVHEVMDTTMVMNLVAGGVGVSLASTLSIDARRADLGFPRIAGANAALRQSAVWRRDNPSPVLAGLLRALRAGAAPPGRRAARR